MIDATTLELEKRPSRSRLGWVLPALFSPRETFPKIARELRAVWLTPLLLISLATLGYVAAAGWLQTEAAARGDVQLPPDFQYYPPAMQEQILQSVEATSSPVFLYIFPALVALAAVWIGWLLLSGILHLTVTLLGGRGSMGTTLNLVAWAGLPIIIREVVRSAGMLSNDGLLMHPGLSGFAPAGVGWMAIFATELLKLVDVYLIWTVVLLVIGVSAAHGFTTSKAVLAVFLSIAAGLALKAASAAGISYLSMLTIARPFFY
ncbi:MAG: Yip1 family protein [Anaerolineales bacterium]|nr:Yip1 family protein [Anaerolineales bacterium]